MIRLRIVSGMGFNRKQFNDYNKLMIQYKQIKITILSINTYIQLKLKFSKIK